MLDLAIDLRHRLFTAHRQHGMAEADHDSYETNRVWQRSVFQPAKGIVGINKACKTWPRRQVCASHRDGVDGPGDQQDDHHRSHVHDPERLLTGLWNSFDVFPPEIECAQYGEECRGGVDRKLDGRMEISKDLVH